MKHYHKNPRTITEKQIENLRETLPELGDLGGIVHDLNSDEVIGGNQRIKAMGLLGVEPVIVQRYDPPNAQGTVVVGYYEVNGEQFKYRAVMWTPHQCEKANVIANKAGGAWDFDTLANDFEIPDLLEWGFKDYELGMGPSADEWADAFDALPDGDRAPFQQMTFTLHDTQVEQVKAAMTAAKALGAFEGSPNENSNGNALARICETFETEHGQS